MHVQKTFMQVCLKTIIENSSEMFSIVLPQMFSELEQIISIVLAQMFSSVLACMVSEHASFWTCINVGVSCGPLTWTMSADAAVGQTHVVDKMLWYYLHVYLNTINVVEVEL